MSEHPSQVAATTFGGAIQMLAEMSAEITAEAGRRRYSASTAARVVDALHNLERIDDVVTISAIARRTGASRPTVRAVLRQECGWTPEESRRAHHAGIRRGRLLQAVAGHPELARGRATLQGQGWPNLQRAQRNLRASAYPALERGRQAQAARGWPSLQVARDALATERYPQLERGRANLAARGWPNAQRAHDTLRAQGYLPLLEAQRLRTHDGRAPQTDPPMDRRRARGRTTHLAILAALQADEAQPDRPDQHAPDPEQAGTSTGAAGQRVTARELAAQLHLHPSTVYAHLKQITLLCAQ